MTTMRATWMAAALVLTLSACGADEEQPAQDETRPAAAECEQAFERASRADEQDREESLSGAFAACTTLSQFIEGNEAHPVIDPLVDPAQYAESRCAADEPAIEQGALCRSLATAEATPTP